MGEENRFNQVLKQKAYQVLIDKVEVEAFEKYLYRLVEGGELKTKPLLYDFIDINYKSVNYKKELLSLIEDVCLEKELLSLKIYNLCLSILSFDDSIIIFKSISDLSNLFIESDYQSDLLYEFFCMNNNQISDGFDYYSLNEKQIILRAKSFSEKVIIKFNYFKTNENWNDFLNYKVEEEKKNNHKIANNNTPPFQNKNAVTKLKSFIKGILGLR